MSPNATVDAYEPAGAVDNGSDDKWAVCPCGKRFRLTRLRRLFCSDHCRNRTWLHAHPRQRALFDARPLPPVVDQRVPRRERKRLGGMSLKILELLRQEGKLSDRDLACLFGPGAAWRTRVSDARLWLEQRGETIRCRTEPGGLAWYWIEEKP